MQHTYVAAANSTGDAQTLGEAGEDVRVFKVFIGTPIDGGSVTIFNKRVAYTADTGNIAFKLTEPTAAAGKDWVRVVDFGEEGLPLDGGSFHLDQSMQVTVLWDKAPFGGE
jgi:hypothetical protein